MADSDVGSEVVEAVEAVEGSKPAQTPRPFWRRWAATILTAASLGIVLTVLLVLNLLNVWGGLGNEPPHFNNGPLVNLNYTSYIGQRWHSVNVFLGVKFAEPPVGDLRWRLPVEPKPDHTTHSATAWKPVCLALWAQYPNWGQSEDCLYANVFTPANATAKSKLPVWVFIQGGGYITNSNPNWNGVDVVERSGNSIVYVNFNYRVGLWGFLASERVRADGDLNVGLHDQRALLQWVQRHIAAFGGDPDHVVIHGASAGAGSVALHMTANSGRDDGLFVGAAAESVFFPQQPHVSELEWQFDRLADSVGCGDVASSKQMACLRGLSTATLQHAHVASPFPGRKGPSVPLFYWTPCIDGSLIADLPYRLWAAGKFVHVPVLYGTDTDEGSVFAPNVDSAAEMTSFLRDNYPRLTDADTAAIRDHYPRMARLPNRARWFPSASAAYGESTFICPAVNILTAMNSHWAGSKGKLFSYRWDVADAGNTAAGLGVPHLFEAAAIMGPDNIGGAPGSYYSYNAGLVPVTMDYWISFVRALDPNVYRNAEAPEWPEWGTERSRLVFRTDELIAEDTPAEQVERCDFWQGLAEVTYQRV